MAQTRTSCPRCRQPVQVETQQLFDLNIDPQAKARLLRGEVNQVHCEACGFQGQLPTPVVYHDPEKELLLTYFPPEMGMQLNDQERLIGPMITQVVNKLPNEKRKAYIFRPQSMFTYQTLIEKVLEADGITKEMLEKQQKQLGLLQRLLQAAPETRVELIKQDETLVDENLFMMLARVAEMSMGQGDQQTARLLAEVQKVLLEETEVGRELRARAEESQAAVKSLQDASQEGLTREKLLDLMVDAPSETRLVTLVSMTRTGMDYEFFQAMAERIEAADEAEKARLIELREKMLKLTEEIDKAAEVQRRTARNLVETIIAAPSVPEAMQAQAGEISEMFMEVVQQELQTARKRGDLARSSKIQEIIKFVEEASAPPPEVQFISTLAEAPDEEARQKLLAENAALVTDEMLQMLNGLVQQTETQGDAETLAQIQTVYRSVLRFSMQQKLKAN